jgi:hypothetical protein
MSVLWWWLVKVRVRWKTEGFVWKLSDSCHQHANIKSIGMFEDDVTSLNMLL